MRSAWFDSRTGSSSPTKRKRPIVRICLAALIGAALLSATPRAEAAQRRLTLAEAVEQALRVEPLVAEARIGEDRGKLGVLRAQLDRVSLKIDGQLQELFNKSNIGGPKLQQGQCRTPAGVLPLDETTCAGITGATFESLVLPQSPERGIG